MTVFIRLFFWAYLGWLACRIRSRGMLSRAVTGLELTVADLQRAFPNHDFSRLAYSVQEVKVVAKDIEGGEK